MCFVFLVSFQLSPIITRNGNSLGLIGPQHSAYDDFGPSLQDSARLSDESSKRHDSDSHLVSDMRNKTQPLHPLLKYNYPQRKVSPGTWNHRGLNYDFMEKDCPKTKLAIIHSFHFLWVFFKQKTPELFENRIFPFPNWLAHLHLFL